MDQPLNLLKGFTSTLATTVAGPLGGAAILLKLPSGGAGAGTWGSMTYTSSSLTDAAGTHTSAATAHTDAVSGYSLNASSYTLSTSSQTYTPTQIVYP